MSISHHTKKKVLLQVRHGYRGLMTTCNEYLKAFDAARYEKIVVFLTGDYASEIEQLVPADQVIFLGYTSKQLRGLKFRVVRRLFIICKRHQVDIIVAHRYKAAFVVALLALFYHSSLLINVVHGINQFGSLRRRVIFWLLFRKRFLFIGVSEAVAADIRRTGSGLDSARVLGLPNCLDLRQTEVEQFHRVQARAVLGIADDDFVFGHVGRLSPSKDQATMIAAFARATANMPNAKLVIVGYGRLEHTLKEQVKTLGLGRVVIFTGKIDNAFRIMPAFDVFVLTSKMEGLGRVLLEAMAARLPLITTSTGGIPEVAGEITELCKPGDIDAITRQYLYFYRLDKNTFKAKGEQSYQNLLTHFTDSVFRRNLSSFINRHLEQKT